jgi:hypothetical protein
MAQALEAFPLMTKKNLVDLESTKSEIIYEMLSK